MAERTPQADALRAAAADTQRSHTKLLAELTSEVQQGTLPADKLIARLFAEGTALNDQRALQAAQQQKALGNPPGKGSSIGDGVNWETLLVHGTQFEDLHFVSADGDFASALGADAFDEYLANEWARSNLSDVEFYRDIKSFLDKVYPQIRLASDVRRYFLIDALVSSASFASSHATVAELGQYDAFSVDEATRLLSGGLENTQVRWLARDDDLKKLLRKVIDPHRAALPKRLVDSWDYLLAGRGDAYGPVPSDVDITAPGDGEGV
jgi:hypothetical protein